MARIRRISRGSPIELAHLFINRFGKLLGRRRPKLAPNFGAESVAITTWRRLVFSHKQTQTRNRECAARGTSACNAQPHADLNILPDFIVVRCNRPGW